MSQSTVSDQHVKLFDIKKLIFFIIKPRQAFQIMPELKNPAWLMPMLLLSLGVLLRVIISGFLQSQAAAQGTLTLPPDWEWWSPDMQNNYMQGIQTTQGPAYVYVIPSVTGLIGLWLSWPIMSSMLHLFSTLLGGRGSQASTLNAVAWSSLPFAWRDLLRTAFMLVTKHTLTSPGLSGFISSSVGTAGLFGNLLKHTDLFLIWVIGLLIIGLHQLDSLSKSKTWIVVLVVVALSLLAQAGLSTVLSSLNSSVISRPFYF
jgi:hypothetical protein